MPALGADMATGKVVEWLVKSGDHVKRGDVVAVVETHKGAIDVECFLAGIIEPVAPLGAELPVGAVLAHVHGDRESETAAAMPPPPAPTARSAQTLAAMMTAPAVAAASRTEAPVTPPGAAARARVSPAARRRAAESRIDPDTLAGSGGDGAVILVDVEAAIAARAASPRTTRGGFDPVLMRQAIATAMSRSKREIPHYYLAETVPMRRALDWLRETNLERPVTERLLPAVLLIKAVALALREFPELNGWLENDAFRASPAAHVGVAISLRGGGLVAPALHDVTDKPLARLMRELADLVRRSRTGGLRSSELTAPSVTVTNLGDQGVQAVWGVIYPPQVALVGFGGIADRPWVDDGAIVPMPIVTATLAADHRASDGHRGALFLARLRDLLQHPDTL